MHSNGRPDPAEPQVTASLRGSAKAIFAPVLDGIIIRSGCFGILFQKLLYGKQVSRRSQRVGSFFLGNEKSPLAVGGGKRAIASTIGRMEKNALGKATLRQKLRAASGLPLTSLAVEHEFGATTLTIFIFACQ
jgi:hypothetical protein